MSERELLEGYLEGRVSAWTFVHRLVKSGVALGVAVAFAAGLPSAAETGNLGPLEELTAKAEAAQPGSGDAMQRMLDQVVNGWVVVIRNGNDQPLETSMNRLAANVANDNVNSANFTFNERTGGVQTDISGNMNLAGASGNVENWNLNLSGTIGNVPIEMDGSMNVNLAARNDVNLNLDGNAGNQPVNLNGNSR